MTDKTYTHDEAVKLIGAALGGSDVADNGDGTYTHTYNVLLRYAKISQFSLFWIKFWCRVGWKQRAQWIILQNLKVKKWA